MNDNGNQPLTYKDAGVDIEAGNQLVERIKQVARRTRRPEVMSGLGGFGALCEIPGRYREPVLVSGTDGVGTKLKLAMEFGVHDSIGIDLVAMCVNDLIVAGAEPLQFLDYYATGKLNVDIAADVIAGIGKGCEQAGCALVGGETAEMPGMYEGDDYDLAGFCVGVAEKSRLIDGTSVHVGDRLIGLPSSGLHSNGYSLVRKVIETRGIDPQQTELDGRKLSELLLEPTRIYVKPLLQLLRTVDIRAMAHITGGGILENLPRVLPNSAKARINRNSWTQPAVFDWLQDQAGIDETEMMRTFNCGIGMILVVAPNDFENTIDVLHACQEPAIAIGEIAHRADAEPSIEIFSN